MTEATILIRAAEELQVDIYRYTPMPLQSALRIFQDFPNGAVFDGRYVYFVPRGKNYGGETGTFNEFQSNLLRYDTHKDFKSSESWAAYDMGVDISKQSAAFDGRYIYFCPGFEYTPNNEIVGSSKIIRFDTEAGFKAPSSYRILDVNAFTDSETGNYDGAFLKPADFHLDIIILD